MTISASSQKRLSVANISRFGVNLGWQEIAVPVPIFAGDTHYAQPEILSWRASNLRPHMGIASFKTTGFKQDGTVVMVLARTILVYKRGHVSEHPIPNIKA